MHKGKNSGAHMSSHRPLAGLVGPALWKTLKAFPKEELTVKPHKQPQKIGLRHLEDTEALELIRRYKAGEKQKELAQEYGISPSNAYSLCTGMNRGHLLRMVEEGHEDHRLVSRHVGNRKYR